MTAADLATSPSLAPRNLSVIPILFNIHVEPDLRIIDFEKRRWLGYENLHAFLFKARPIIEQATKRPVHFNWLFRLDQQIAKVYGDAAWVFKQYGALIQEAKQSGDALGVHVHSWRPQRKGFKRTWIAEFSDEEWVASCIDLAHQSFANSLGEQPQFFSFGDHFMSPAALAQLEKLGFRCDVSMHPGRPLMQRFVPHEETRGWLPSFLDTPRHAFKPSRQAFSKPGSDPMKIWEIPVSIGHLRSEKNPQVLEAHKLLLGMHIHQATEIIEQNFNLSIPYLLAEMRSDVRLDAYNRKQFDQTVDYLIEHPMVASMQFSPVPTYLDQLDLAN